MHWGNKPMITQSELTFRLATVRDVEAIVRLLADDPLGQTRERISDPLPASYYNAFTTIAASPNVELLVACKDGVVVSTLQLTFTPSMSHEGRWRATIESVRTAAAFRRKRIGTALMRWAIQRAKDRGCAIVQLSTHKSRHTAKIFYQQLDFESDHDGMTLKL